METTTEIDVVNDSSSVTGGDITFNIVSAVCWTAVTPTVILANTFMLMAVHRSTDKDDINQAFIATTALTLLITCLCLSIPASISSIAGGRWILGSFLCTAQSLFIVYMYCVFSFLLFSHSLERFVFLVHPLRYPRLVTMTRVRRLVGTIILIPLLTIPLSGFLSEWHGVYIPSSHVCAPYSDPVVSKAIFVSFFMLLSAVPSVIGYVIHTVLLLTIRQHLRRIIAGIPRPLAVSNDNNANGQQMQQVAVMDRRIRMNKAKLILLTIVSPVVTAMYVCISLALFGFPIPKYLVLLGNIFVVFAPVLLGLRTMTNSKVLKRSARQIFKCC